MKKRVHVDSAEDRDKAARAKKAEAASAKRAHEREESKERAALAKERKESRDRAVREKKRKKAEERAALEKERQAARIKSEEARKIKRAARQKIYRKIKDGLKNNSHGFDYCNFGIIPRLQITVSGDSASIVARLSSSGIVMDDLTVSGRKSTFKIRKKDRRKAVAIFEDMCYNYSIDAEYGIGRMGAFWLARIGLLVGAAVSVVCLNISYGYVWRIEISGNDKLSTAAIESVLSSADITVGRKKRGIDTEYVSAAVNRLDGVADATAEIVGTTLHVYVLESKDFTVRDKCSAYAAAYDATVTRIVLRDGTATVKRGDVVKCGDILANGDVFSTAGELLYTAECDAEVYGDVSITYSAEISAFAVEYRRTGRSEKKTGFEIFGRRFMYPESPYTSYESIATTANYDVLVPLYVTTFEFFETEPVQVERDIDEAAKEFAAAKIEEMNFSGEFKSSYTVKQTVSGLYSIHLFLSGETLISRSVERPQSDLPEKPPTQQ